MGLSIGLNTAVQALRAHQLAVDVAAHNIANVQTPGYSRQRVLLRPVGYNVSASRYSDSLLGKAGNGVDASDVNRVRDLFLDAQARQSFSSQAQYGAQSEALARAELTFNEPGEDGLNALMSKFWNAAHDVADDPESMPARTALVNAASTLASRIKLAEGGLQAQRRSLDAKVGGVADRINASTGELARLNKQIVEVESGGDRANDLRDRRDLMLDNLSAIGAVTYNESANGSMTVFLGTREVVVGNQNRTVTTVQDPLNSNMQNVVFTDDMQPIDTSTGELSGILQARDGDLPALLAKVNSLASGMITAVNAVHSAGYGLDGSTGTPFFTGADASSIAVNAVLMTSPEKLAAASVTGAPGNAANMLAFADLQNAQTMVAGTQTFGDYYTRMVTVLGADVDRTSGQKDSSELLSGHLETMRLSVSGVSIDEEVTNMNAAQHAYQAAGRVITTIDDMLDTLINRTGMVGR